MTKPLYPDEDSKKNEGATDFERASQEKDVGFVSELLGFLAHNKKWWLLPILIVMLLLAGLVFFAGSGAAPFIYTLF